MQTLKIKYHSSEENISLIKDYQRQYSCVYRWMYNRTDEGMSEKEREHQVKLLNNIDLLDSWFIRSACKEATYLYKANEDGNTIIFGGKKNYFDRLKGNISKEEYKDKRLSPLCSIGEGNQNGNRKFQIQEDLSIIFKPDRKNKIIISPNGLSRSYKRIIKKLYILQSTKSLPITYKISSDYIYIIFDESMLYPKKTLKCIENRVMSIDLNPNYIGWSIVDWISEDEYKIIKSGVYSIKEINDINFQLKKEKLSSTDKKRIYLSNKRHHEIMEISKNLINKCLYYQCENFVMEELSITHKDNKKGKKYNKLVNNCWCRDKFVNNLKKRCNINNISLIEVKPQYNSFIGNILYRETQEPDMVLASIEIGRRGYEFNNQYIKKTKEQKKNIIQPVITNKLKNCVIKSMEEIGYTDVISDNLIELYYKIKNLKFRYRVSLDDKEFFRCFSKRSRLMKYERNFLESSSMFCKNSV